MRLAYRPELDGVRAIAILAVMMFHSYQLTSGWLGVEVFFVLSGFLITSLLLGEWGSQGTISLSAFYRRRTRRLLPALVTAIAGFLLLNVVVDAIQPGFTSLTDDFRSAATGLLFLSNVSYVWWKEPAAGLLHLWTLSTEEQFYLVWPVVLLVLLRFSPSRRRIAATAAVGSLVMTVHGVHLASHGVSQLQIRPDTGPAPLLIGCACACLLTEPRLKTILTHRGSGFVEAVVAGLIAIYLFDGLQIPPTAGHPELLPVVLLLLALAVGFLLMRMTLVESSGTAGFLRLRGLVAIGRWSYSLYLWHMILIHATPWFWVHPQVAELIAVPVAAASYRFVEQPFLRKRKPAVSRTPVRSAPSQEPWPATA